MSASDSRLRVSGITDKKRPFIRLHQPVRGLPEQGNQGVNCPVRSAHVALEAAPHAGAVLERVRWRARRYRRALRWWWRTKSGRARREESQCTASRLPQRHSLACLESKALTININEIILPMRTKSLIISQVTMMHWGILWLLHYHSINLKSLALPKR